MRTAPPAGNRRPRGATRPTPRRPVPAPRPGTSARRAAARPPGRPRASDPPAALDALLDAHADRVWRVALALTRTAPAAERLARRVFGRLLERPPRAAAPDAVALWLCREALREAPREARAPAGRRAAPPRPVVPARPGAGLVAAMTGAGAAEDPGRGSRAAVEAALAELGRVDRVALVLADAEGLSADALARVLGRPPAAVRRRVHRARLLVRDRLAAAGAADPRPAVRATALREPRRPPGASRPGM